MEIPERIQNAASRLAQGQRVNRITVRDFLRHFGAERRGATKVEAIRSILDSLGLETDPDFESVWIDEPILLRLKNNMHGSDASLIQSGDSENSEIVLESTPSAVEQSVEQSKSAPTSAEPDTSGTSIVFDVADPTFRIGILPAANKALVTVGQDDTVERAVTLMLQHDFSQLPVMQGEREVKGVISWKSIGMRKAFAVACKFVRDCQDDAVIIDSNRTLFDSIGIIIEHSYVLVRGNDKRITGIVTASDLSLKFRDLSEPFLLLREIELHVREILRGKIDSSIFAKIIAPSHRSSDDLSRADFDQFGSYPHELK